VCACTLIVAAFPLPLAAATIVEDAPVPGGVATIARALGIDPVPDRARFMHEVTRLVYETVDVRSPAVAAFLQNIRLRARVQGASGLRLFDDVVARAAAQAGMSRRADDLVPVPLTADAWGDVIFRRRVSRDDLVLMIIADRQASLVCHALTSVDDETLEYLANHSAILTRMHERSAPIFAAFARSLHVHDNRVIPPGGADAVPLWEAAIGEKVTRADRFVNTLFDLHDGRMAYLYDTIGQLPPARQAFALGAWIADPAARLERFKALATAGVAEIKEWHARVLPFGRSSFDLGMAFSRLEVDDTGAPTGPMPVGLWSRAFDAGEASDNSPIDAAWLAQNIMGLDVRRRGERLDQIGLVQRAFARYTGDRAELLFVVRAFPKHRALMLTLERIGMTRPETYAAVVRHAAKLAPLDGRRGFQTQAQLQASLALIARMAAVRTLSTADAERLIERLIATPVVDGIGYAGGIARWLREDLYPALPPARDVESALIAALAGRPPEPGQVRRVTWEGQEYRLDLAAAERQRLQRVRQKQHALAIDLPLQMADAARLLGTDKVSVDDVQDAIAQFTALATDVPQRSRDEETDNLPVGVGLGNHPHEALRKAIDELTRAVRNKELKRAAKAAEPIVELADDLLARNLLSFVYATSIGDPDGTVLLADDVSHRHDFGFGMKDVDMRARLTWAIPRTEVAPGVPWHVSGSLLGLDVALSTLALRRVAADHVLEAPKLTSNARDTFATSVALMDPLALNDADRDTITGAIERGGRRVAAASDAAKLDALADELALDAARRRALRWTLGHEPGKIPSMLSLTELLTLGGARTASLHAWGMAVIAANGCLCSRLVSSTAWPALAGRPQLGLSAVVLPDLTFRIAMVLKELDLPAALAKVVLSAAMQDFIDEVRPTDDGDWLSLSRSARDVTRERVEDYVAAATATGPLMPLSNRSGEPGEPRELVARELRR